MLSGTRITTRVALLALAWLSAGLFDPRRHASAAAASSGVAILQVDTDHHIGTIDRKIYGQFLEHINHSVVDGLFAEQIRGAGFEGRTSRPTGQPSDRRTRCASSRLRSSVARRVCE